MLRIDPVGLVRRLTTHAGAIATGLCLLVPGCGGGKTTEAPDPTAASMLSFGDEAPKHDPLPPGDTVSPQTASAEAASGVADEARPPRTIFRSELQRATRGGPAYLLRQLMPEPFRHRGEFMGWEITAVFPDDPDLCDLECDLEVGDIILSVNGDRIETPQALSNALGDLPKTDKLVIVRLRDGKRRTSKYTIVDDRSG